MPINRAFQRLKKPRKDGFHMVQKGGKMENLKKIAKIKGFESKELKEMLEAIENKGFQVLWDERPTGYKRTWKILKTVENE